MQDQPALDNGNEAGARLSINTNIIALALSFILRYQIIIDKNNKPFFTDPIFSEGFGLLI